MVKHRQKKWRSERNRILHALRMSKLHKTRHNWRRVDLPKYIAEDIETIEYRHRTFIVTLKANNERYVIEIRHANLRQLDELERFVKTGGKVIEPKIPDVERPFKGTELDSIMQKKRTVVKSKVTKSTTIKGAEIIIERKGKYTRIVMPKGMDDNTICLVLK